MDATTERTLPETLYFPPGEWGDCPQIMSEDSVNEFLEWAGEQGDDWASASISDAEECNLVRAITTTTGLYEGGIHHDGYHKNCRRYGYVIEMIDDKFRMVEQLDTVDDCVDSEHQ